MAAEGGAGEILTAAGRLHWEVTQQQSREEGSNWLRLGRVHEKMLMLA